MVGKRYETTEVPISRAKYISLLVFASLFCLAGVAIIVAHVHADGTWVLGVGMLILGLFALFKWRRPVERKLTEKGSAEKAIDDHRADQRRRQREAAFWSLSMYCIALFLLIYL